MIHRRHVDTHFRRVFHLIPSSDNVDFFFHSVLVCEPPPLSLPLFVFATGSDNEKQPLQPLSHTGWQQGKTVRAVAINAKQSLSANSFRCQRVDFTGEISIFLPLQPGACLVPACGDISSCGGLTGGGSVAVRQSALARATSREQKN